jgi:hypothetical protein
MIATRTADRLTLARQTGYLTTTQTRGCGAWLDTCHLCNVPYILVIKNGRYWRLRIEMERWRLTPLGCKLMHALLTEHSARQVMVLPDACYGYGLTQEQAEHIAGRLVEWVRSVMEVQA